MSCIITFSCKLLFRFDKYCSASAMFGNLRTLSYLMAKAYENEHYIDLYAEYAAVRTE